MDHDRFPLSTSRQPNPLRPYYIPPSIGAHNAATASNAGASPAPSHMPSVNNGSASSTLGRSAREILPDLDLDLASTTNEAWQQTRRLFDTLAWRYTSVVLSQPFDVAKTIMQVSLPPDAVASGSTRSSRRTLHPEQSPEAARRRGGDDYFPEHYESEQEHDSEASDDIPDYFTSSQPRSRSPRRRWRTPPPPQSLSPSPTPTPRNRRESYFEVESKLHLKRLDSITNVISSVYNTSGAVGCWRATHTTFLYSILLRTTDSFIRSLLLAIVGLPDIASPEPAGLGPSLSVSGAAGFSGLDLSESPNPFGSVVVIGLSACLAGILLVPLDLVRTRLIITPNDVSPRGLVQSLRRLPSLTAPSFLWLPTALHHAIPQMFSAMAPMVLKRQMRITPETTPSAWSLAAFTTSLADLFLRLPLETILRRAQVSALKRYEPSLPMIIEPAPYTGVWSTVYNVLYTEGEITTKDKKGMLRKRRGQGPKGLVRGWRIGFWGLVGVWGAGALGPGEQRRRGQF